MTERIQKIIDDSLTNLYKEIKSEDSTNETFKNAFWRMVETIYSTTYGYVKKKITKVQFKALDIMDLLYDDKDEDRIDAYYAEFVLNGRDDVVNQTKFLQRLVLIFDTEGHMVHNNIFIKAAEHIETELSDERHFVRVKLYVVEEADCGAHGKEVYWREASAECGHPGCDCEVEDIEVEIEELEDGFIPELDPNE